MSKRKVNYKRIILIILFNLFLSIILIEIGLRVFNRTPNFQIVDLKKGYNLSDNRDLIYVPSLTDERHEFRTGYKVIIKKNTSPSRKRVFFIGDSVTESIGSENSSERFVERLDRKLSDYEIINAGVSGYNILQEKEYLKERVLEYNPDLVVFQITYNDLELMCGELDNLNKVIKQNKKGSFYKEYYEIKDGIRRKLYDFHIYRYYRYLLINNKVDEDLYYEIDKGLLSNILEETIRISKKNDFDLVLILFPINTEYGDPEQMYIIKEEAEKKGVKVFDLNSYIQSNYEPSFITSLFFPGDPIHLSAKGQIEIADTLYETREEWLS